MREPRDVGAFSAARGWRRDAQTLGGSRHVPLLEQGMQRTELIDYFHESVTISSYFDSAQVVATWER